MKHVRSKGIMLGPLMNFFNPLVVKFSGTSINSNKKENIRLIGMEVIKNEQLFGDMVKLFTVVPNKDKE